MRSRGNVYHRQLPAMLTQATSQNDCTVRKFVLSLNFDIFQEDLLIQCLHPQLCVPVGAPSELALGPLLFVRITRRRRFSLIPLLRVSVSNRSFAPFILGLGLAPRNRTKISIEGGPQVHVSCQDSISDQPDRSGGPMFVLWCTTTARTPLCDRILWEKVKCLLVWLSVGTNIGKFCVLSS